MMEPGEVEQLRDEMMADEADEEVEVMFVVEKILGRKKEGRRTMYLVKWEGFEEKDATWEPLANLGNVKELIKDFEKDFICTDFSEPTELSTSLLQSQ